MTKGQIEEQKWRKCGVKDGNMKNSIEISRNKDKRIAEGLIWI